MATGEDRNRRRGGRQWRSPSLKILSCASAAIRCLRWLFPSVSSERWWSRNATRGDSADTSVCTYLFVRAKFRTNLFDQSSARNASGAHNSAPVRCLGDAELYTHLKRRDAALQLRDVLQLAHARPLRGLPIRQDPASFAAREAPRLVNSASQRSRIAGIER